MLLVEYEGRLGLFSILQTELFMELWVMDESCAQNIRTNTYRSCTKALIEKEPMVKYCDSAHFENDVVVLKHGYCYLKYFIYFKFDGYYCGLDMAECECDTGPNDCFPFQSDFEPVKEQLIKSELTFDI